MLSPACGLLLHITSLPGPQDSGDLGPGARRFVSALEQAGVGWWQMLPVGPPGFGGSPYDSPSAFAGSTALISLEDLFTADRAEAFATSREASAADITTGHPLATSSVTSGLRTRFERLRSTSHKHKREALRSFREHERGWIEAHATFAALNERFRPKRRDQWPRDVRTAHGDAVSAAQKELSSEIDFECWLQHQFAEQWTALRRFAHRRGVRLIGDMPIFVASHSADVWAHPELFDLDEASQPRAVAGVPPDSFSATGQLWGHPVYLWAAHRRDDFGWWRSRLASSLDRFDMIRIDHFRGLVANWRVPAGERTAERGHWSKGPVRKLWSAFRNDSRISLVDQHGWPSLFAEDLGHITPAVRSALEYCDLWGTRVVQFADDRQSEHHPDNVGQDSVLYTGTHDNDTTVGWLSGAHSNPVAQVFGIGEDVSLSEQCHQIAQKALASRARLVVLPLQDVLSLGSESRMNTPGTTSGNWAFRAPPELLSGTAAAWLENAVRASDRTASAVAPEESSR